MLRAIRLENFKAFGEQQELPLAPITLIFGPNSAGKSSIIQSIMLFSQSVEGQSLGFRRLIFSGESIDLGSAASAIHNHDISKTMGFGFTFARPKNRSRRSRSTLPDELRHIDLRVRAAATDGEEDDASIAEVTYSLGTRKSPIRFVVEPPSPRSDGAEAQIFKLANKGSSTNLAEILAASDEVESENSRSKSVKADRRSAGMVRLVTALQKLKFGCRGILPSFPIITSQDDLFTLQNDLGQQVVVRLYSLFPLEELRQEFFAEMQAVSYLGPLRSHPARHYISSEFRVETVGNRGERTPQVLYKRRNYLLPKISDWFERFGIPYSIKINRVGNEIMGAIISIVLEDKQGLHVSPADVGFGIGQLLPILVEGSVSLNRTICVEQPEIHLHPKLQAHVADFLIDTAKSQPGTPRATGGPVTQYGGNQWIVETHSEALMLRLMRRIGAKEIPPEFVSVLYVEPIAHGQSRIYQLRLDENGDFIDEWPDGFFEERYKEIFGKTR